MNHLSILPILVPAMAGIVMLTPKLTQTLSVQRWLSFITLAALVVLSFVLIMQTHEEAQIYVLGGWQPPFGIILVADRLSALLVALTSFLAFCAIIYGSSHTEASGRFFYPLFMFQVMGVNGAFLTGDIFNLFVFFEVLLIASYALLIHGGGKEKTRAGVQYITLNMLGSAFFLFALGTLYGTLGTLNMADMSVRITEIPPADQAIAKAGALLLLLVFGLKSAMLPLHFWLPKTYAAASAPVAAMFAIMTKVGLYSIYRVFGGIFGDQAGHLANLGIAWIWPLAIATLVLGMLGALAAPSLRQLAAYVVIMSVGTLLLSFVINDGQALGAGLYYLIHSTLASAALFLLADQIQIQRGPASDRFVAARPMRQAGIIGSFYFAAAIAIVGLPPLSGFVGKALVLQRVIDSHEQIWVWSAILISSLLVLVAFSRAGTSLFWHLSGNKPGTERASPAQLTAISLLLLATPMLTIFAGPVAAYTELAAADIQASQDKVLQAIAIAEEAHHDTH